MVKINYILMCSFGVAFSLTGQVCYDKTTSGLVAFCCADYEEHNDVCIPCGIGYVSDDGGRCRICPANTYGKICAEDCNCRSSQRCHHIEGCIKEETSTNTLILSTDEIFTDSRINVTVKGIADKRSIGFSRKLTVYYIIAAAVLIIVIVMIVLCILIQREKMYGSHTLTHRQQVGISEDLQGNRSEHDEVNESLYDIIDENNMNEITNKDIVKAEYLEVINVSRSNSSDCSENPAQQLPYTNKSSNLVSGSRGEIKHSSSTSFGIIIEKDGYLNPYEPLCKNHDIPPRYETKVFFHQEFGCINSNILNKNEHNSLSCQNGWRSCSNVMFSTHSLGGAVCSIKDVGCISRNKTNMCWSKSCHF